MTAVRMMQTALKEVIRVITVRHRWMPAALVAAATADRGTNSRVVRVHGNYTLVVVSAVSRVEMPVVQVVNVVTVLHMQVATRLIMGMRMTRVGMVIHRFPFR